MAAFPKPHPALGCAAVHFLRRKAMVKRGGEWALKGHVLVWHWAASEVGLGGLMPFPQSPGPQGTAYPAAHTPAPMAPQALDFTKL